MGWSSCLQLIRVHTGVFSVMVVMSVLAFRCGFTFSPTHIHTDMHTPLYTQRTHADSPLPGNVVSDQWWRLLPTPLVPTRRGFLHTLQVSCLFNSLTHAFPAERSVCGLILLGAESKDVDHRYFPFSLWDIPAYKQRKHWSTLCVACWLEGRPVVSWKGFWLDGQGKFKDVALAGPPT